MNSKPEKSSGQAGRRPNFWLWVLLGSLGIGAFLDGCTIAPAARQTAPAVINVVAAENFYGNVASQVGGSHVQVLSILSDPNVDPHVYESSVDDAKAVADARVVIKNGAGYDAFMDKLLAASPRPNRIVIDVAALTGHKQGDNPHLWYDTFRTMPALTQALAQAFSQLDPSDQAYFSAQGQAFVASLRPIQQLEAKIKQKYAGVQVMATEPLWNYQARASGLNMLDAEGPFQRATQDGNDPPAFAVARFRDALSQRSAKLLVFNSQAVTPLSQEMQALAKQNNIPVVAMSETEPANTTYQQWMTNQLQAVLQALGG